MTPAPIPTAEQQLEFLQRIQRLFEDGNFSATYKYALLMALAELAVELGADDGNELPRWQTGALSIRLSPATKKAGTEGGCRVQSAHLPWPLHQLARNGWISHIRQIHYNHEIVGPTDDLEGFMFGTSRNSLQAISTVLAKMQSGRCYYCDGDIRTGGHVDHFIPWSRYPRDLAHNFVLAHTGCNSFKSDMLAARVHLDNWVWRNEKFGSEIAGSFGEAGFVGDEAGSRRVASWAYGQAVTSGGIAWVEHKATEPVSAEYLAVFT